MSVKAVVAASVTLLLWSSAFAGIRVGLAAGYTAGHVVLIRFLSASAVFVIYAAVRKIAVPRLRDIPLIAVLGFSGISVYHIALTFGERTVQAGTASLIIASAPAFTALIAAFALSERLNRLGWLGIGLGFGGVAVIAFASGHSPSFTYGALLLVLAAVGTSFFFVYQKALYTRYSPIDMSAYFTWFGTIPMLWFTPGLIHQVAHVPVSGTLTIIYIGVFPAAIAYGAWAIALSVGRAGVVTSALYLEPVLAIIVAWIWIGEVPHLISILGGALATAGVIVTNLWGHEKTVPTTTALYTQAPSQEG